MRKNRNSVLTAAAVTAASLFGASAAQAQYVWDGGATPNPNWSNVANWVGDTTAPSLATDTVTFDATGIANPANTVDPGLAGFTFQRGLYRNNTGTYTTSIDRSVDLSFAFSPGSNTATSSNATFVVMPLDDTATVGASTLAHVVFNNTGAGANGALKINSGNFLVSGRPGTSNAFHSAAILDLSALSSFTFTQAFPQQAGNNTTFGIGTGQGAGSADNGAQYGKLILPANASITSNRVSVGGQNSGGTSSTNPELHGIQPVSHLMLGQNTNVNTNLSGNVYAGGDPGGTPTRTASGAWMFQAGLTNPVVTIGANGGFANGLEIARHRAQTGHSVFGVMDFTSASGTSEGDFNGVFAGWSIGAASSGVAEAGGGFGMLSMNRGSVTATNITLAFTNSAPTRGTAIAGVLNVGLKGTPSDTGGGTIDASGNLVVGQRTHASAGTISNGTVNIDNNGSLIANRTFIGNNTIAATTGADKPVGSVIGIVNLNGGTLTTGQVQKGADPATQLGTNTTRIINFDGGTLRAKTGTTFGATFMEGLDAALVRSGGATLDSNGQDIVINQPLVAPTGDGVQSVTVDSGGSNYKVAPIVMITGGGGTGATGVARINAAGAVIGVDITNPGTGYTSAPLIELVANGGSNAPFGVVSPATWGNYQNLLTPYGGSKATMTPNLGANTSGGITKTGAGKVTLGGANTYTGPTNADGGTLALGQSLTTSSAVNVSNNAVVELTSNGSFMKTIKTSAVSATTGGKIDLQDNKMIVVGGAAASSWNGTSYGGVAGLVQSGYNGGDWAGTGIVTTQTNAISPSVLTAIVTMSADEAGLAGGTLGGQTVASGDQVLMYSWGGDANMDGTLNGDDYFEIDSNIAAAGTVFGYGNGDFNYDGDINGDDYFIIDSNIAVGQASTPFPVAGGVSGLTAVPEPASIGVLALAACGLARRRRRSN